MGTRKPREYDKKPKNEGKVRAKAKGSLLLKYQAEYKARQGGNIGQENTAHRPSGQA